MPHAHSNQLLHTVDKIFSNVDTVKKNQTFTTKKNKAVKKQDLELALTVLLVDLASCDEKFQPEEYHMIANGLRQLFGTQKHEVQALVNQASQVLKNLRGTSNFATMLKDSLNEEDKLAIMDIIEDMINADGVVDGFEIYLKNKINSMLGLDSSR